MTVFMVRDDRLKGIFNMLNGQRGLDEEGVEAEVISGILRVALEVSFGAAADAGALVGQNRVGSAVDGGALFDLGKDYGVAAAGDDVYLTGMGAAAGDVIGLEDAIALEAEE